MMGCEDINTLMIEYIDGALNDEDARRVDEHLSSCEDCRAEMANMKSLLMKLDDFEMEEPSENLKRNFQSMVDSYSLGMNNRKIPWHEAVGNWIESWWPKRPLIQFVTTVAVLIIGLVTGLNISYKTGSKNDIAQL